MPPVVNLARTQVTVVNDPSGKYNPARFVYHNGRAAVWVENKTAHTATRVLYATDAEFIRPQSGRDPMRVVTGETEWLIRNQGGCGCGAPTKRFTFAQLLDPEMDHIG